MKITTWIFTGIGSTTLIMASSLNAIAATSVHLYGELSAKPCVVSSESENISVEFGNIVDKYLYANKRTNGIPFDIVLSECDTTSKNSVKITILGTESKESQGMISLDPSSQASGFVIGLENKERKQLPINKSSDSFRLENGENRININAYLMIEPKSKIERNIERGFFSATVTFYLDYQ